MKRPIWFALLAIAGSASIVLPAAAVDSEISKCALIQNAAKRLACFDTAIKHAVNDKSNQVAEIEKAETERRNAVEKEKDATAIIAAKNALKSLKKLQIRVETGVAYKDYPALLSDAKFEVNQFVESPASKRLPQAAESMAAIITHYDLALQLWRMKFAGGPKTEAINSLDSTASMGTITYKFLPETQRFIDNLEGRYKGISTNGIYKEYKYSQVDIDSGVLLIWKTAARDLINASTLPQLQ